MPAIRRGPSTSLRGAERRSNPCFLSVAAWIASLALAMTGRECGLLMPASRRGFSTSLRGALATKQSILSFRGGVDCFAALAMTGRERGPLMPASRRGPSTALRGALATKQSILSFRGRGLLRCARHYGEGVVSASCRRFVEVLPRHSEEGR